MDRRTARRALSRTALTGAVLSGSVVGAVLLSGTGQPVTARPYPHWQRLADPPLSPRTGSLAVRVGHRVLVLGGRRDGHALRDGASYDLTTGRWRHLDLPVALSARDAVAAAAGVAVIRHRAAGHASWWTLRGARAWTRLRQVPPRASAPVAFGSEVYAVAGRRVVVYSVSLDRWTRLPADPVRPRLTAPRVSVSRHGTVVSGSAAGRPVADRWDGVRWRRTTVVPHRWLRPPPLPSAVHGRLAARIPVGGRWLAVAGTQAWIRSP